MSLQDKRGRADIQITEWIDKTDLSGMLLRGVDRQDGQRIRIQAPSILRAGGENDLCAAVHLVLPRSDSALTGFTGIEDVPTVPHRVGPMRFEAMRKVGARAAGARGVWREEAGVVAPAGSRAGHPLALRLVVRASSTFWRGLSRLQWRRFSTDEDGEGDAGAGGAGDAFVGRAEVRNLHKLSPTFARLLFNCSFTTTISGAVYSTSAATAAEDVRQRILRYIRSLPREDQILIHQMYNAYKDKFGLLYIHIRLLDNSDGVRVIVKAGRTDNLERRIGQYSKCGPGILWISCYPTEYAKATERIIHLQFEIVGAKIQPFLCACKTTHHEYSCYEAAGELEGAERVVEAALRSLGQEAYRNAKIDLRLGESRGRRSKPGSSYGTTLTRSFLRLKNPETNPFKLASQYSASQLKRELYKLYELVFIEYSGLVRQMKSVVLELFRALDPEGRKLRKCLMLQRLAIRDSFVLARWAISITASCQVAIAQGKKDATEGQSAIAFPSSVWTAFQVLNAATNKLLQDAEQLELSLASVGVALEQQPLLPQAVHNHIGSCRIGSLTKPERFWRISTPHFFHTKSAEDPESQYEPGVPNFRLLPTVHPKGYPFGQEENDLRVRAITYAIADHQPTHQKWRIPNLKAVKHSDYPPPASFTSWKGFFIYSPADAGYDKFSNTGVDISERGRILILQKDGLTPAQCPDLETWKASAKISAREQEFKRNVNEHESLHPSDVGSPFPGSSPPSEWGSEPDYTPGGCKRKAISDQAESVPAKKQKVNPVQPVAEAEAPGSSTANVGDVMQDEEAHDVEEKVNDPGSPGSVISISSNSDRDEVNVPQSVIVISSTASVIEIFDSDESDSDSDLPSVLDLVGRAWS
ncbi:hypothetical protein B0H14DRAFT_2627109 [Mycena olivaceomarginata]|nr:hypothetical protein B0H14DRAFT_2627109 [Mycena olivaceomarginata]